MLQPCLVAIDQASAGVNPDVVVLNRSAGVSRSSELRDNVANVVSRSVNHFTHVCVCMGVQSIQLLLCDHRNQGTRYSNLLPRYVRRGTINVDTIFWTEECPVGLLLPMGLTFVRCQVLKLMVLCQLLPIHLIVRCLPHKAVGTDHKRCRHSIYGKCRVPNRSQRVVSTSQSGKHIYQRLLQSFHSFH